MDILFLFCKDMDNILRSMSSTFRHVGKNISNNAESHFIYFKNDYTGSFECEAE